MFFKMRKIAIITIGLMLILAMEVQGITPAKASTEASLTGTIRVSNQGVTSSPCGEDWANPCDLQYALSMAASGSEIWVKNGTYYPDLGAGQTAGERGSTFHLKDGVAVYGGFTGVETTFSERNMDPSQNGTILSGDLGASGINTDNAYHVVAADFVSSSTRLDGFTISGGNANGGTDNFGGGLYSNESNPVLKNIIFTGNSSNGSGGGMFVISQQNVRANYTTPALINVSFIMNTAARGGGMATQNSSPSLTNVIFKENTATAGPGGGMANWTLNIPADEYSAPTLTNVTFTGNTADGGGGLFNSNSNPLLTNITFSGNTASLRGGAIYNDGASATLNNVTITGNVAPVGYGGAIRNVTFASVPSHVLIENSILWGDVSEEIAGDGTGSLTIVDSVIQSGCPTDATCTNVLSTNPVLSGLANNGGFTPTMSLGKGSSAVNAGGVNSTCASDDQRGALRPQGDGCDMGALEAYLLTVIADSKIITYGMAEPVFSFHYDGLIDGDTAGVIDTPPTCGVSGAHTNAGSYTITCSGGTDNKYILFTYVNSTLTIDKATPSLSVTNTPLMYDGAPHSASVVGSIPGNVTNILTDGLDSQTNAGTYAVTADFVPTDTLNYNSLNFVSAGNFVISKVMPIFTVTNSPITYDTSSHTATVTSSVPGTISNILVGGSASQTNAGTYAVTVNFLPNDAVNYATLTGVSAGNFVISKATPTIFVTNSPTTYDGSPHPAIVAGSVPGTASNILTGGFASRTNAGTYAVTANFAPTDTVNYNSLTGASAGNFVISKANPILSVTNSPLMFDGLPHAAGVTGSVPGIVSNVLIDGSAFQTNAGTYAVTANFAPTDTANYNGLNGASAGNFVINKATPTLSVTNTPVLYDGLPHGAILSSSVPGTISNILVGGSATQTDVGTYTVTANFIPTDTVNYKSLNNASAGKFVISIDITPPATQITVLPSNPSSQNVTFAFTSDDETAVFECQMDGKGFSACTSPKSYMELNTGSHTFMVRAIDPFDNMDSTPASYTWGVSAHPGYYMVSRVITPFSITTQGGLANDPITRLWYLEQSGIDNNTGAYINFQTPQGVYNGYHSFYIPEDIQPTFITNALLQVNFNGPDAVIQTWTWSAYDWTSNLWIKLGDTVGSTPNQWNSMALQIKNIRRLVSPSGEIRIRLLSSNGSSDLEVDYAALHITFLAVTINPTSPAPVVPALRPGIASTTDRMVR